MEESKKLYRVTLRGMSYSTTSTIYGTSYVVATNPNEAYKKVRAFLDKNDLGYSKDRELDKIELLAEAEQYTDTRTMLHI